MTDSVVPIVISAASFGVSLYTLYASRLAGPRVGVYLGSWVGITTYPKGDGLSAAFVLDLAIVNTGAQPAFVHDLGITVGQAAEIPIRAYASFDLGRQASVSTLDGQAELTSFTGVLVPAQQTAYKSLLFLPEERISRGALSAGEYDIRVAHRLVGHPDWRGENPDRFTVEEATLARLDAIPWRLEAGVARADWRVFWQRLSSSEQALSRL
jgi:hypothetical protein